MPEGLANLGVGCIGAVALTGGAAAAAAGGGTLLSESESELTTKGSNRFDLELLAKEGPSACEVV